MELDFAGKCSIENEDKRVEGLYWGASDVERKSNHHLHIGSLCSVCGLLRNRPSTPWSHAITQLGYGTM